MPTLTEGVPTLLDRTPEPVLTFDDGAGQVVSLTRQQLRSLVARTANMLIEGCGLGPGAKAAVLLPARWETAAVLLAAWSAGLAVEFIGEATAGLTRLRPDVNHDAVFVAAHRIDRWLDPIPPAPHRFVIGGQHPDYVDFVEEVQRYDDDLPPAAHYQADPATVDGTSYGAWLNLARAMAESSGITPGDRVEVDATDHEHPLPWLLAPLSAGASVLVRPATAPR